MEHIPGHMGGLHPRFLVGFVLLGLLFLCNVLLIVVYPFVLFLLAIALSVIRRLVNSDYPFGIFKLFHCLTGGGTIKVIDL
jgi:hypothetical protein